MQSTTNNIQQMSQVLAAPPSLSPSATVFAYVHVSLV